MSAAMEPSPAVRPTGSQGTRHARLLARLDRLSIWSMPGLFVGIIGLGTLFNQYDIFDINVSFIQTCLAVKPGCTAANAAGSLSLPVLLNLVGYGIGALMFSPVADRIGRRNVLMATMLVTGLGSLYTTFVGDYTNFVIARTVTGIGVGADLAIVQTYINEVAPRSGRAKYTSLIFTFAAVGSAIGVWLGLLLTTSSVPWPKGLPVALAGPDFTDGWRWMYGVGAVLALIALVLRFRLPESPRWLAARGRLDEAEEVVAAMERRAARHGPLAEPGPPDRIEPPASHSAYVELLRDPRYVRRVLVLGASWFAAYITVYGFAGGLTAVLSALGYPAPEAGMISAIGVVGFIACAVFCYFFGEGLERKYWLPIGAAVTVGGALVVALAGTTAAVAFLGAAVIFFGFNVWIGPQYSLTAESFPTRVRTTGYGLVDSIGHIGGGIGVLVIGENVHHFSVLGALLLISGFLVLAALIVQASERTKGRRLEDVSP